MIATAVVEARTSKQNPILKYGIRDDCRMEGKAAAHLLALFTVAVWGLTFISTKNLLESFTPIEVLVIRFFIGLIALFLLCPHLFRPSERREEIEFALAGLFGVCFYFLFENFALTYTYASNVGVIVAVVPFFTALFSLAFFSDEERLGAWFFPGFIISMTGIGIVSFGSDGVEVDVKGDLLALSACFMWAIYSVILRRISSRGYNTIQVTRRTFIYGLMFMVPIALAMGFDPDWGALMDVSNLKDAAFLGVVASAVCYVTWALSISGLGVVSASQYIYLIPVITVIASAILLGEPLTCLTVVGVAFTLAGLILSQRGTGISEDQDRS